MSDKPVYTTVFKTDTLSLEKSSTNKGDGRGFWLWDETQQMNLSMRAESEREALIGAIEYYQRRLQKVEKKYNTLRSMTESFVEQVTPEIE